MPIFTDLFKKDWWWHSMKKKKEEDYDECIWSLIECNIHLKVKSYISWNFLNFFPFKKHNLTWNEQFVSLWRAINEIGRNKVLYVYCMMPESFLTIYHTIWIAKLHCRLCNNVKTMINWHLLKEFRAKKLRNLEMPCLIE